MEQLTVNQLYKACQQAIAEGYGDRYIISPDDNEGNGYHGVFYALSPIEDDFKEQLMDIVSDSAIMDPDKLIILG